MPDPYGKRIQELLDRIEEKYPPERIAAAERKWRNLWDFNQPFSQPPAVLHRGRSIDGVMHYPIETPEERRRLLELKLQDILLLAEIEDDYIPVLFLDAGAYILAEAFGGERSREKELYITSPFLMTEEEIAAMPEFRPEEEHRYAQMVFETLRLFREETAGRIPINIHTPQGPLETFGCMCDSSCFFLALLDDPAAVMKALNKVVDGYIWYIRRQLEILGEQARFNFAMSYTPRPSGTGIGVGDDVMATISPECFRLTQPLYERIAGEFGGILLHSCGNPAHQLPLIMENRAIRGIHFSQLEAEEFMPRISRPVVVHSRNDWKDFDQLAGYARTAKQYRLRIAYQFQSLGQWMQVGDDRTRYNPGRMREMFLRAAEIIESAQN